MTDEPRLHQQSATSKDISVSYATYPMAFDVPGGGEFQLLNYADFAPQAGLDISFFDPWDPRFDKADIFHFFSCIGGSVHLCNHVKQRQIPLVVSSSLWITAKNRHHYNIEEISAQLNLADRIVTNSKMESDTLAAELNIERKKFYEVYNGYHPRFLDECQPDLFRSQLNFDEEFFLCVGNIEPRKNQLLLAEAMAHFPNKKLVLVGQIRDQAYFEKVQQVMGERCQHFGFVDSNSELLHSAYSACEIFCLPSTLETPGLAALEALAANCQVVVTSEGSTKEYFGDNVTYCDPYSLPSLLKALSIALDMKTAMSSTGLIKSISKFVWPNVVADLRKLYFDLG